MTGQLLGHAADWFKARGVQIKAWHDDDGGRYAFRVTVDGDDFVVCAKQYIHDGRASFMQQKVLVRSAERDAKVLLFVGEGERWLVFDPWQVLEHGQPSDPSTSRRARKGQKWLEAPTDWACSFQGFLNGAAEPTWDSDTGAA